LLALLPLLLASCASSGASSSSSIPYLLSFAGTPPTTSLTTSPLKIMVASDLHYLAPELKDGGSAFMNMVENADGKLTQYGEEIIDAFIAKVAEVKPDALFLTGDLTFNGERLSHEHLAEKLLPLEEQGTAVLVIPGNHDIDSTNAYFYREDFTGATDNVDANSFLRIYAPVTYEHISAFDSSSLSYVYPLRKDLYVMALSADAYSSGKGTLSEETMSWAKSQLDSGKQAGVKWLTLSHESVLKQNPLFSSYSLGNAEALSSLFESHDVLANFSGHLHIQHYVNGVYFPDFCSSSLLVSPSHYGVVNLSRDQLDYHTEKVDVASYAKAKGLTDPNLLNYGPFAEDFFRTSNQRRMILRLEESDYTAKEQDLLLKSYSEINYHYFAGEKTDESVCPEGFALWRASSLASAAYVRSMLAEDQCDYNVYQKSLEA